MTTRRAWLFGMAALSLPATLHAQAMAGGRMGWASFVARADQIVA